MNFYFTPPVIENAELNFSVNQPISINEDYSNISDKEIDSKEILNDVKNESEKKEIDFDKINRFYQFNYEKKESRNTKVREKLNTIKIYILVKPTIVDNKKTNVAVPINNYEDLGNTGYGRTITALASTFLMRTAQDLAGQGLSEGSPGSRPFILEHAVGVEPPYDTEEKVSLKDLGKGLFDKTKFKSQKEKRLELANLDGAVLGAMQEEERLGTGLEGQVLNSEINREEDAMLDLDIQILEAAFGLIYYYSSPYEYDYSFLDNTIFTNSRPYQSQPRDEENFNRRWTDLLKNLKNFNFEEQKNDLKVLFTESDRILFKNTTELLSKNIIPVFCDLEEAQTLLVTVLEELTQPYRAIRPIEGIQSTQVILPNLSNGLDYIDDSLTLENHYVNPNSNKGLQKIQEFLKKYRVIKAPSTTFSVDDYNADNYQLYGTKMKKSVYESWQLFFDEVEDLGKPYNYRKGPWDDTRSYLTKSDKKLLTIASEIKIISMGLGDFLEFWNNHEIKNGEVLFIPSLNNVKSKKLPFVSRKSKDRFYEYQQKFGGSQKYESNAFTYEITISDN